MENTKDLFLVCHNENYDHSFCYSDRFGGWYGEGGDWQRQAGFTLCKGGVLMILISVERYSDSEIILDNLVKICAGENPSDFNMRVHRVFNSIDEWSEY